ncbi:hypothetical protein PoB_002075400 [Plakobranchus ocellatus]|uniref:Uncharacterized protein n=1 Tax=Plakobranchus ocellatus TaxID=259542 RepID=A0AAV3ZIP2_9GAST|nr:hypothetical protein PoB_002075400 [Plakobranchus ocellatus]
MKSPYILQDATTNLCATNSFLLELFKWKCFVAGYIIAHIKPDKSDPELSSSVCPGQDVCPVSQPGVPEFCWAETTRKNTKQQHLVAFCHILSISGWT